MGKVRFGLAVSLDGYVAGPEQSLENPLGIGGMQLHEWAFRLDAWRREHGESGGESNPSSAVVEEAVTNVGAFVMGRNMFGGGPGPWDDAVNVSLVPLLLGAGERLFDNLGDARPRLELVRVVEAPDVTHLKYRVVS